jgi:hypothetical protein
MGFFLSCGYRLFPVSRENGRVAGSREKIAGCRMNTPCLRGEIFNNLFSIFNAH